MKFTTPCFVRVEDAEKRKELIKWLVLIGYVDKTNMSYHETIRWLMDNSTDPEILAIGIFISAIQSSGNMEIRKMIDCGSNIELFKALAAMNDESNLYQWFICTSDSWNDVKRGDLIRNNGKQDHRIFFEPLFRKATAKEIVDYFKDE